METTNQNSIDILNNLLEINNDRMAGYKHAVNETDEGDLRNIFTQFVETSCKCKNELVAEIQKLGGTPIEGTRTTGKLYRGWMDIKAALTNRDRKAILESCEFGEDTALRNYEKALKEFSTRSDFYPTLNNQYVTIKSNQDKIKYLLDILVEH